MTNATISLHPDAPSVLPPQAQLAIVGLLNARLADMVVLRLAAKQAHWTVRGPNFQALHGLFDEIADRLDVHIDAIAERVMALGGQARGTAEAVLLMSRLPAYGTEMVSQEQHLDALIERFAIVASLLRDAIDEAAQTGDADTADLFTSASRDADKDLWFLRAHLSP